MRAPLVTTLLAAAIAVAGTVPAAAKQPTRRQIARAVRAAEDSKSLWATVNICNTHAHRDEIGVRGQMPSLGFSAQMLMTIKLNAYSATTKRFVPVNDPNAVNQIPLGAHARGLQQSGAVFPFGKRANGRWNATIVFTWKRNGAVLGQAKRTTAAGHPNADFGDPAHYSAAACRIG